MIWGSQENLKEEDQASFSSCPCKIKGHHRGGWSLRKAPGEDALTWLCPNHRMPLSVKPIRAFTFLEPVSFWTPAAGPFIRRIPRSVSKPLQSQSGHLILQIPSYLTSIYVCRYLNGYMHIGMCRCVCVWRVIQMNRVLPFRSYQAKKKLRESLKV